MSLHRLVQRIRKLETGRDAAQSPEFFMLWAVDEPHIQDALALAKGSGAIKPGDPVACMVWPLDCPAPIARWTKFSGLSEAELRVIAGRATEATARENARLRAKEKLALMSNAEIDAAVLEMPGFCSSVV